MTVENCLLLAENCKKNNDLEGAKMYRERAEKKKKKYGFVQEKTKEKK